VAPAHGYTVATVNPSEAALSIEEGDTLASVQQRLGIQHPPAIDDEVPPEATFYHFPELGFWVFFRDGGLVYSIRFDAPFALPVNGVRIGDSRDQVRNVLGRPARLHPIDDKERWISDQPRFLRVDFDPRTARVDEIYK
jgi:hypothetical protein